MARPRVTVITPSFNQGGFIERTIRSVLDQGYPDLEYVIVDGGSTDETVEIIRRYEDKLAWWVSEPDRGQTDAINKGIERTSGEIVAYLNSDDYLLPGALERVVQAFAATERSWVAGAALDLDEHDRPAGTPGTDKTGLIRPTSPSAWEGHPKGRQWWLVWPWHVPQPSAFWRRELFGRFGVFRSDMDYAFDAEFMIRLAIAEELPEFVDGRPLAVRVHHDAAKSSDYSLWRPEIRQIVEINLHSLNRRERRRLHVARLITGIPAGTALSRAMARIFWLIPASHRTFHRGLGRLGDLLDYVPERWRPRIRTRDRRRSRGSESRAGRTERAR